MAAGDAEGLRELQYNLRVHLHAATAKIVSAVPADEPHEAALFERRCAVRGAAAARQADAPASAQDLAQVDAWVSAASLAAARTDAAGGWTLPPEGLRVPVGKLVLDGRSAARGARARGGGADV